MNRRHGVGDRIGRVVDDINARVDEDSAAAATAVTPEVEETYRSLPSVALKVILAAFRIDHDKSVVGSNTREFCRGRVALIEQLLLERRSDR